MILRVVDDAASGVVRVLLTVPAAGDYYVQLFENTVADERDIFPVDADGFEGRRFVADSPAQAGSVVNTQKPPISGTLVAGNVTSLIEIPAARVAPGNWITATATRVTGTTPGSTSPFSAGVQVPNAPIVAVGGDGPATWSPSYSYTALSGSSLEVVGLSPAYQEALASLRNVDIVLTPTNAAAGQNLVANVVDGQGAAGSVILNLATETDPSPVFVPVLMRELGNSPRGVSEGGV